MSQTSRRRCFLGVATFALFSTGALTQEPFQSSILDEADKPFLATPGSTESRVEVSEVLASTNTPIKAVEVEIAPTAMPSTPETRPALAEKIEEPPASTGIRADPPISEQSIAKTETSSRFSAKDESDAAEPTGAAQKPEPASIKEVSEEKSPVSPSPLLLVANHIEPVIPEPAGTATNYVAEAAEKVEELSQLPAPAPAPTSVPEQKRKPSIASPAAVEPAVPQQPTIASAKRTLPRMPNSELDAVSKRPASRALSENDILRLVLENNLDIKVRSITSGIEGDRLRSAKGAFDPVIGFDGRWEKIDHPQTVQEFTATGGTLLELSQLGGNPRNFQEENWRWKSTLSGKLPLGTKYEFFDQSDILNNTLNRTSPLSLFSAEHAQFRGLTITQPLLRDFGTGVNLTEIRIARKNLFISKLELRANITSTVAEVLSTFYDLAFSEEETELRREELKLARRLTEDKRTQLERGVASTRDYSRAESSLADSVERLVQAELRRTEKQSSLDRLIEQHRDIEDMQQIRPMPIFNRRKQEFDRNELMKLAIANRPDYLVAQQKVEREQIKILYAENQIWPRVDFKSTAGVNGLDRGWYRSWRRSTEPQGYQINMGVGISFPIGNQEAMGKLHEALKTKEQALALLQQAELNTILDINRSLEVVEANYRRLEAMRKMASNVESAFEDEKTRMEKGQVGETELLKFHRDVTEARTRELAALNDYNKALVALSAATGTLLQDRGVILDIPEAE